MGRRICRGIGLALGFGLAKAVTYNAYNTAFGSAAQPSMGFVSSTGFVLAGNVLSALVAIAVVVAVVRGVGAEWGRAGGGRVTGGLWGAVGASPLLTVACGSCLLLAVGYVLGIAGVFSGLPTDVGLKVLTLLYSLGSVPLTVVWFVPFARAGQAFLAVAALIAGYLVQAGLHVVLSLLGGWVLFVVCVGLLVCSCVLLAWAFAWERAELAAGPASGTSGFASVAGSTRVDGRPGLATREPAGHGTAGAARRAGDSGSARGSDPAEASVARRAGGSPRGRAAELWAALRGLSAPLVCVAILTAVVGMLHTSVIGGTLEPVVGAIPMAGALTIATLVMAAVVLLFRHVPDTTLVYRVLFPVMLAALSLLPFVSEALGPLSGMAMVVCYELVSIAFMLLLVEVAQARPQVPPAALMGAYLAGTKLALVVGLLLGLGIDLLGTHASEASYVTVLMLACIYLLSMVLMVLLRRRGLGSAHASARSASRPAADARKRGGAWHFLDDAGLAGGSASEANMAGERGAGAAVDLRAEQQNVREQVVARMECFARERGLTPRESQVLVQLARGRSAPALAADLGITDNTAWAHIKRIYAKLGVHGKQELIELVEREVVLPTGDGPAESASRPGDARVGR